MNDENTNGAPATGSPRKRTVAVAAAVGVAGLVAGGLAAGAISAASADSAGAAGRPGYGNQQGYGGPGNGAGNGGARPGGVGADPSKPMRSDEKLLTGATKTKVLAAVKAKYPDATVQRVETDSEGVYEAHIINDAKPLIVQVGKDFKITGTQSGPTGHDGGAGGMGGPRGGEQSGSNGSSSEDSSFRQS